MDEKCGTELETTHVKLKDAAKSSVTFCAPPSPTSSKMRHLHPNESPSRKLISSKSNSPNRSQSAFESTHRSIGDIFEPQLQKISFEYESNLKKHCCFCDWSSVSKIEEKGITSQLIHTRDTKCATMIANVIDGPYWTFCSATATVLSLFLRDVVLMALPGNLDWFFLDLLLTICVIFFSMELVLCSIAKVNFFGSFFFWLDIIGTASLIIDVPWIQLLIKDTLGVDFAMLTVAKGGRMGRAARSAGMSKMMTRMIRMVRMLRVVRTARCFRDRDDDIQDDNDTKPSRVGTFLADDITKKIILIVLIMLISTAMIGTQPVDPPQLIGFNAQVGLELMEHHGSYWGNFSDSITNCMYCSGLWFSDTFLTIKELYINDIIIKNESTSMLRPIEVITYQTQSGQSKCTFDQSTYIQEESAWNIILMLFVIIMFCFGSFIISSKANVLVVKPIEKMVEIVKNLTTSLLGHEGSDGMSDLEDELETEVLQDIMSKIGQIFHTRPLEKNMGFNRQVNHINILPFLNLKHDL